MSWWQYILCCADVFYFDIFQVWLKSGTNTRHPQYRSVFSHVCLYICNINVVIGFGVTTVSLVGTLAVVIMIEWRRWRSFALQVLSDCLRNCCVVGNRIARVVLKYLEGNLFRCLLCPKHIPRGLSGKRIAGSASTARITAWALVAALDGDKYLRICHRTLPWHQIFLQMWLTSPTTWILF